MIFPMIIIAIIIVFAAVTVREVLKLDYHLPPQNDEICFDCKYYIQCGSSNFPTDYCDVCSRFRRDY